MLFYDPTFLKGLVIGLIGVPVIFFLYVYACDFLESRRAKTLPGESDLPSIPVHADPYIGAFVILPKMNLDAEDRLRERIDDWKRNVQVISLDMAPTGYRMWRFDRELSVDEVSTMLASFDIPIRD